jgi:5-formyltetrahydrofolate cyclo-ligase
VTSPVSPNSEIAADKAALRVDMRERRARLRAAATRAAFEAAASHFLGHVPRTFGASVALYVPLSSEFDPLPLLTRLDGAGYSCALPVAGTAESALTFRRWRPGEPLAPGRFGLREPSPDAPDLLPDIVVAPCLAFDRRGYRLGYGAGYYDRTLAALREAGRTPLTALLAFAGQEVARVPADAHDQRADWIVTEDYAIPAEADA